MSYTLTPPSTLDLAAAPTSQATARILQSDAQALQAAKDLAKEVDLGAAERDAERQLPWDLLARFSAQGLSAVTVPKAYGGADVSIQTLVDITIELADADPAFAQIPQNHFAILERLRLYGSEAQKQFFYPRFLAGDRLGNATAEPGDKRPNEHRTQIKPDGAGFRITGRKIYATGALYAQWVPVSAVDEQGHGWVVYAPRHSEGLTVIDNWDSFGQRTTASGEVVFKDVYVDAISAFPSAAQTVAKPDTVSHVSQLVHIGIDLGIARRAIRDTLELLRSNANPARGSGLQDATQDPLSLREIGHLKLHYHAAVALTNKAAELVDQARASQDQIAVEQALLAVMEAKILSTEIALQATNKLFELVGTHSTQRTLNLDRHWRNARTHTLHDGVRWKYVSLGQYYLNHQAPDAWAMGAPYRARLAPLADGE